MSVWLRGLGLGLAIGAVGFALRGMVGWPLEGLFAQITYALGVPAVFNWLHQWLGYGEAGKNLAFVGTLGLWLLLHVGAVGLLLWRWPTLLLVGCFYAWFGGGAWGQWFGGALAGLVYSGLLAWGVWGFGRVTPTNAGRRQSLKTMTAVSLAVWWGRSQAQTRAIWNQIVGLSPEQLSQQQLYYVSKNLEILDPKIAGQNYRLAVKGLVRKPLSLSLAELKALPATELQSTMTCISNPVGGDLIGCVRWRGVLLRTVLDQAGLAPEARWVVWEAADRFSESIALSDLPPEALLAYAVQNPQSGQFEDLEARHGYPTRILLPPRYGMKQPKWLTQITLSANEVPGYWAQRGWSRTAVIRTMSRIDTPRNRARLAAGQNTFVAGVAYAGGRPIERVEVSLDAGISWQKAELKPPRGKYAWQLWALPWKPAKGEYTLQVRVVEVGGRLQEARVAQPLPDGATGYHTVRVSVS